MGNGDCSIAEGDLKFMILDPYIHVGWPLYQKYGHAFEEAMRKDAAGNKDCPVKIKLVAPPYVLNTQTLDKEEGIAILNKAIAVCSEEIERQKGKLTVKEAARAVSEHEDKLLAKQMAKLTLENEEVSGDKDSEEEEDSGMGDVDLENSGTGDNRLKIQFNFLLSLVYGQI